jgi:predicted Zn-dependent protease
MTVCSRREWLRKAGIQAAAVYVFPTFLLPKLIGEEPLVADRSRGSVSDADEIALGQRFAAEFEREAPVVSNVAIDRYLNSVVRELAAQSQRPDMPYRIRLINTLEVNASSLPGGTLYVNRGLLEMLTSEDELAATLAHEIGHIVARHAIHQLMLTLQAKALLQAVLDNLNKQNGVVEKIILQLGGAVALLARLQFSRQDDAQADLLGFYEALRAGWDPRGFVKMFDAMQAPERVSDGAPIAVLSGHPPTPERLAAIQHEITQVTIPEDARTDSVEFRACKAALRLLPDPAKPHADQLPTAPPTISPAVSLTGPAADSQAKPQTEP